MCQILESNRINQVTTIVYLLKFLLYQSNFKKWVQLIPFHQYLVLMLVQCIFCGFLKFFYSIQQVRIAIAFGILATQTGKNNIFCKQLNILFVHLLIIAHTLNIRLKS